MFFTWYKGSSQILRFKKSVCLKWFFFLNFEIEIWDFYTSLFNGKKLKWPTLLRIRIEINLYDASIAILLFWWNILVCSIKEKKNNWFKKNKFFFLTSFFQHIFIYFLQICFSSKDYIFFKYLCFINLNFLVQTFFF